MKKSAKKGAFCAPLLSISLIYRNGYPRSHGGTYRIFLPSTLGRPVFSIRGSRLDGTGWRCHHSSNFAPCRHRDHSFPLSPTTGITRPFAGLQRRLLDQRYRNRRTCGACCLEKRGRISEQAILSPGTMGFPKSNRKPFSYGII